MVRFCCLKEYLFFQFAPAPNRYTCMSVPWLGALEQKILDAFILVFWVSKTPKVFLTSISLVPFQDFFYENYAPFLHRIIESPHGFYIFFGHHFFLLSITFPRYFSSHKHINGLLPSGCLHEKSFSPSFRSFSYVYKPSIKILEFRIDYLFLIG